MKLRIFTLVIAVVYLSSCQKDSTAPTPVTKQSTVTQTGTTTSTTNTGTSTTLNQNVTVVDTTKGYLRVQLAQDAANTDNILIHFNPTASSAFVKNEDAPSLAGFGTVSLSSLSSDNVKLAINTLPLSKPTQTIGLVVNAAADGTYKLNMTTIHSIPAIFDIWLKDNYKKDSVDFRQNPSYAFDLKAADTTSFGSHRFSIVLRAK